MSESSEEDRAQVFYREGVEVGIQSGKRLVADQLQPIIAKWREVAHLERREDAAVSFAYARCATEVECFVKGLVQARNGADDAGYLVALEVMGELWLEAPRDPARLGWLEHFVRRFLAQRCSARETPRDVPKPP